MRRSVILVSLAGVCLAGPAAAFEYPLLFTPLPNAQGLVVAGYAFKSATVVGNCSYKIVTSSGGRGGHSHTTYFNQTCTWDLHGNLLAIKQGAPTAPRPISTSNGLTIYARNAGGDTTGLDASHYPDIGFVNTPSAQYGWLSPSGGHVFPPNQQKIEITLSLQSEGDFPLAVKKIVPSAALAKASVKSTTCAPAPVPRGKACTVVITYDPSVIPGGDDPYTAYDRLTVGIVSNSGQAPVFSESIEVPISPTG